MKHATFAQATWRLLSETRPCSGAMNMAIDEALLHSVASGLNLPTLRLYQWDHPVLTLGRGQHVADADEGMLRSDNIPLLRRMTGGTAVLNDHAISYTVTTGENDKCFDGSISESYRGISQALIAGLNILGLQDVEAKSMDPTLASQNRHHRSPVCFEIPSYYEITVRGKKLVGSSQMRTRGGILQHGTFYLDGDIGAISSYLSTHPDPDRIRAKTITLYEAIGKHYSFDEIVQALVAGFSDALNLEFSSGSLIPWEWKKIEQLLIGKYENPAWTSRL